MTTQKPKPQVKRAYITIRDPDSKAVACLTVYDATPEQVKQFIKSGTKSKATAA